MMEAEDVLEVLTRLRDRGIPAWIDGGWGIDALVDHQTRPHDDLDLVVPAERVEDVKRLLEAARFTVVEDELPTRFAMRDAQGRTVDFHPVTFDEQGNGMQRLQDGRKFAYLAAGFAGRGLISAQLVPCLTAEVQLLCHVGYEPDANDWHDMELLRRHFGVALPEPYRSEAHLHGAFGLSSPP